MKKYKVIWAVKQNNYVITENNIKNNDSIKRAAQATEIVRYKNFVTKKNLFAMEPLANSIFKKIITAKSRNI